MDASQSTQPDLEPRMDFEHLKKVDGAMELQVRTEMAQILADMMAGMLKQAEGYSNFLTMTVYHADLGKLELSLQRVNGLTAQEKLAAQKQALRTLMDQYDRTERYGQDEIEPAALTAIRELLK